MTVQSLGMVRAVGIASRDASIKLCQLYRFGPPEVALELPNPRNPHRNQQQFNVVAGPHNHPRKRGFSRSSSASVLHEGSGALEKLRA